MSTALASRGRAIAARSTGTILTLIQIAGAGMAVGLAIGATIIWKLAPPLEQAWTLYWLRAEASLHFNPMVVMRVHHLAEQGYVLPATPGRAIVIALVTRMIWAGLGLGVPLAAMLTTLTRQHWISAARRAAIDQVLRGNRVATAAELAALIKLPKDTRPIRLGGVSIPEADLARHLLIAGKSGSGKTTALRVLVQQIAARGEHALIFDPDGSFIEHFYDGARGDVILDPWDARTARWNPLADIASLADATRIASVLLPKPAQVSESGIWYDQARTVLAHILDHQARHQAPSIEALGLMLNSASADTLRALAAGTPAARVFEAGGERATASVLFMLTQAARTVALLAAIPEAAPAFSFDRFYTELDRREGAKSFIFLAAPRRYREAAAPLLTAWIDAAASAILQRVPDQGGHAWLILDELASLPPIQSLLTLLPEGRKYRACVTIAFQSIAQLQQAYGEVGTQIVTGQTATQLLMAAGDAATARWAVELIGTVEVEHQRASESLGADRHGQGSIASHRERKSLVIDAEVTALGIGEAYLRLSAFPIARVRIAPANLVRRAPGFVPAAEMGIRPSVPAADPAAVTMATPAPTSMPATPPPTIPTRIEDRDDWMTTGAPS